MTSTFTDVFSELGNTNSIIDVVDPTTGRSAVNGETLEEVRRRYPTAEQLTWDAWSRRKVAIQDQPVAWTETTEQSYMEMLNILPPLAFSANGFLVGEPWDHHAGNGRPRFAAYIVRHGRFYTASRPMTVTEFVAVQS